MELMNHLNDDQLQSLAAGSADPELQAAQLHLGQCLACQQSLAAYRKLFTWIEETPAPEPGADFAALTASRILQKASEKSLRRIYVLAGLGTIAAMVAAVILIFFAFGKTNELNSLNGGGFFANLVASWNEVVPGGLLTWIAGAMLITAGLFIEKWLPRRSPLAGTEK